MSRKWIAWFAARPRLRAGSAWAAVLTAAAAAYYLAWVGYDEPGRPEHTVGHIYIDFSGQWVMGRMLSRGEGRALYDRERVGEALREAYGPRDGATALGWIIEAPDRPGVGGALYPPIQALFFYPLGLLPPLTAYRVVQTFNLLLTFVVGFLVWGLTRGRVWPAVAAGLLMLFPGYNGALALGQNALVSLALLALGWLLATRGRPWLGGAVWGLLAFKPVWAASFFLVPLLTRRWGMAGAMLLTGLALILLTLPFVGWHTWADWLTVGRAASAHYATDASWIFLSRDLQGIPRRYLLSFDADGFATDSGRALPNLLGVGLWLAVAALTVLTALWQRRWPAGADGPAAAFLLVGAWLSCVHFMYYDTLLAALGVAVLFAGPDGRKEWRAVPLTLVVLLFVLPHAAEGADFLRTGGHPVFRWPPYDTFCLLALWAWCGWEWLRAPYQPRAQASA